MPLGQVWAYADDNLRAYWVDAEGDRIDCESLEDALKVAQKYCRERGLDGYCLSHQLIEEELTDADQ